MKRTMGIALAAAGLLAVAGPAAADVDLHGFVEGAWGVRVTDDPVFDDTQDYTLSETRAQIRLNAYGDAGEVFVRTDILQDNVVSDGGADVILREAFFRFTTARDHLDVKAGRQALTWGTGDLIFINDLFPKDWESFFAGREDQYLKAPADALRLGIFGLPFDVDLVVMPEFTPDRLPAPGERLSFYLPPMTGAPVGVRPGAVGIPYHPELSVGGASVRGSLLGGVAWAEAGYYDSREDGDGTDPFVENSSLRYLGGWEKQWLPDLNVTVQYYGEKMMDHDEYVDSLPSLMVAEDELRHLWTLRVEKLLHYQLLRVSAFTFWSPTDDDGHARFLTSYKLSDEVEVAVGANVFFGDDDTTMFGQFENNDSVFGRLRYSF